MRLRAPAHRLARSARQGRRRLARLFVGPRDRPADFAESGSPPINVLFVGGTSRSGTTVSANLLGRHPAYARIAIETKFLSSRGGLCDLAEGKTTFTEFASRMLGVWFEAPLGDEWDHPGSTKGLHRIVDRATLESALQTLGEGVLVDPWTAGRRFAHALFDPIARAAGASGWIEQTPSSVRDADLLYRMFPNMRLIHMVRDGRDTAASLVRFSWAPDDLDDALDWWVRRLERGFAATDRVPRDRVHLVQIEDLVIRNREVEYGLLLDFLDLADDSAMREYFIERMTPAKLHAGRWRQDVPPARLALFDAHHDQLARQLHRRGRPYRPVDAPSGSDQRAEPPEVVSAAAD